MQITHSCGHKEEYDTHGSSEYALRLIKQYENELCTSCKANKPVVRYWLGTWPSTCNLCNTPLEKQKFFVDGRTVYGGRWALMCTKCHGEVGCGLGTGYGQKYDSKTLEKVEG